MEVIKRDSTGFSIFSRLLVALLGVVMLISGLLTSIFYVYNRRAVEKQTTENILQEFETINYHFRYELRDAVVKDLQLLASNPALEGFIASTRGRETELSQVERSFLESLKYSRSYESITFVDRTGREVIKVDWSGRVRERRDVRKRPLFLALKTGLPGGVEVEGPVIAPYGDAVFSAGIQKTGAKLTDFSGVVVIDHNLKDFIDYLDKIKLFNENPLWLFFPNGTVVKRPSDPRATLDPRPYLAKGFQKKPILAPVEGGLLVYQDLYINPDYPLLRLAISIPSSLLLHDIRAMLRFFVIVSVVSLLAISFLAYHLAGYLSRPIIELSTAASRLAKGDLAARVQGTPTGEVGLLIDSFNRMGEDLQKTTVSKEYMDNVVGSMMDTLIIVSPDGVIVRMNTAAGLLLEYNEQELIGKPLDRVIAAGPGGDIGLVDILSLGSVSTVEKTYLTRSGKKVPVLFSASVMRNAQGEVQGIVCVAQDITDRKRAEARLQAYSVELQENEQRYRLLVELSPDGIAVLVEGKFVFVNPAGAGFIGASSAEQLAGTSILDIIHPAYREVAENRLHLLDGHRTASPWNQEKFIRLDGGEIDMEVAGVAFTYQGKPAIQVIFRDITERRLTEERLQRQALYDTLTGLPNRTLFFDRSNQLLAIAKRQGHMLAFLYIDLDRFKAVNDTLGHEVGDLLLAEAGRRIASNTRKGDTVARIGGDEFIGICGKIASPRDAVIVAQKIIDALQKPFSLKTHECSISASIGISLYPNDGDDVETLINRADSAMYRVKEQGRGDFAFHSPV